MNDTLTFRHTDKGEWSAEASDIGFAPGEWPEEIVASIDGEPVRARLVALHRSSAREVTHAEYAPFGRKFCLIVWND